MHEWPPVAGWPFLCALRLRQLLSTLPRDIHHLPNPQRTHRVAHSAHGLVHLRQCSGYNPAHLRRCEGPPYRSLSILSIDWTEKWRNKGAKQSQRYRMPYQIQHNKAPARARHILNQRGELGFREMVRHHHADHDVRGGQPIRYRVAGHNRDPCSSRSGAYIYPHYLQSRLFTDFHQQSAVAAANIQNPPNWLPHRLIVRLSTDRILQQAKDCPGIAQPEMDRSQLTVGLRNHPVRQVYCVQNFYRLAALHQSSINRPPLTALAQSDHSCNDVTITRALLRSACRRLQLIRFTSSVHLPVCPPRAWALGSGAASFVPPKVSPGSAAVRHSAGREYR
jgi:hypothetical protein